MSKIEIKIIKPDGVIVAGEYDQVIIPGVDGDFGVLPGHTPFITKIRPGVISLINSNQKDEYAIHDGFITVENDKVSVVCDTIEHKDEIDIKRAENSKNRAMERLKSNESEINYRRAEMSLKRAIVRLEIKEG